MTAFIAELQCQDTSSLSGLGVLSVLGWRLQSVLAVAVWRHAAQSVAIRLAL